jgi:hypothetical protein
MIQNKRIHLREPILIGITANLVGEFNKVY